MDIDTILSLLKYGSGPTASLIVLFFVTRINDKVTVIAKTIQDNKEYANERIGDVEDDLDDLKASVVYSDTFREFKGAVETRCLAIETRTTRLESVTNGHSKQVG